MSYKIRCVVPAAIVVSLSLGCGAEPKLPELHAALDGPQCSLVSGTYAAIFTLASTVGTCTGAKTESHDPLIFGADGNYQPPIQGIATCKTEQVGCQIAVRCKGIGTLTATASLDATVTRADGSAFVGVSQVDGSYKGCEQVVYNVTATRKDLAP